jgi:hypothetical protein
MGAEETASQMAAEKDNLDTARRYLAALERFATGGTLAAFFAPAVVYEEMPNRLKSEGGRSDLATMLANAQRGAQLLTSQRYEVAGDPAVAELEEHRVARRHLRARGQRPDLHGERARPSHF